MATRLIACRAGKPTGTVRFMTDPVIDIARANLQAKPMAVNRGYRLALALFVCDNNFTTPSYREFGNSHVLTDEKMRFYWSVYAPHEMTDPLAAGRCAHERRVTPRGDPRFHACDRGAYHGAHRRCGWPLLPGQTRSIGISPRSTADEDAAALDGRAARAPGQ